MNEKLNEIIMLMEERGYDPIAQLTGYLEICSDDYITRHGNFRYTLPFTPTKSTEHLQVRMTPTQRQRIILSCS